MTWTKEDAREAGRKGAAIQAERRRHSAPDLSPAEVSQQTHAVQARWAAEKGSEQEVRRYFRQDVSIEDGLALLARMRENCKTASETLNARITADSHKDRCLFCGGPKRPNRQWALVRPYRDPTTQLPLNHYFCSIECVALMNQRNHGVYGVADRGMTPAMNPKNHPTEVQPKEGEKSWTDKVEEAARQRAAAQSQGSEEEPKTDSC